MRQIEILECYVDEICDNLDTGNVAVNRNDFYEVIGMLRICYVLDIITNNEREKFRERLVDSWYRRYGCKA